MEGPWRDLKDLPIQTSNAVIFRSTLRMRSWSYGADSRPELVDTDTLHHESWAKLLQADLNFWHGPLESTLLRKLMQSQPGLQTFLTHVGFLSCDPDVL